MTTLVHKDWFGFLETDEEAQLIANGMAVSPEYFSEVSCEGDRLFGLVTNCPRETCQNTCETVLNGCARKNLWQYSYMVQQELEIALGWTLSPRYVTETLPWDGKSRLCLTFGGVEELYRFEDVTTIVEDETYNPYVAAVVAAAVGGQSYTEVLIPFEYLSIPEGVMFKNQSTGQVFTQHETASYPEVRTVGPTKYWALAVAGGYATADDILDVLDCLWGYVDAPCDDCIGGDLAVVYQDSVQKIPIEKTTETRWFIKHHNMVRQEYQGSEVDLTQQQVHKLYDVVDVACFNTDCALITINKKCADTVTGCDCDSDATPCDTVTADGCATLIDRKAGILEIHEVEVITDENGDPVLDDSGCPTFRQKTDCTDCLYDPFEVTVSYRTNPHLSGIGNTSSVETLRRAIAARVAAEVSLVDCGCNVECGFFKEMRMETNTTVFTQSGATVVALKFGNRKGQQIYAQALESAPRNQPVGIA